MEIGFINSGWEVKSLVEALSLTCAHTLLLAVVI